MNDEREAADDPRVAAFEVLRGVAHDPSLAREYPAMTEAFDDDALRDLINISWRHQFDPDRHGFKQSVRALQEYVGKRVRQAMEKQAPEVGS